VVPAGQVATLCGVFCLGGLKPAARAAVLGTAGIALLAGCAAGQLAQSASQLPTIDGASAQAGSIALRDIVIAYPEGGRYARGDSARLEFVAVNEGSAPDTLTAIRADVAGQVVLGSDAAAVEPPETPAGTPSTSSGTTTSPSGTPPGGTSSGGTSSGGTSSGGAASPTGTESGTPGGTSGTPGGTSGTPGGTTAAPGAAVSSEPQELLPGVVSSFRTEGAAAMLVGLTRTLLPTQNVRITFVLQRAGEVSVEVPVTSPETELPPPPTIDIRPIGEG
jgi:copper(I)-binding protein